MGVGAGGGRPLPQGGGGGAGGHPGEVFKKKELFDRKFIKKIFKLC